jgi:4-hydroxyphenylpyruvate dioxygenase
MLQIDGIDYVEFYVGNASQAAHFYRLAFGFTPVAQATLETGERERTTFVLRQNDITLVLTSALSPQSPVAEHVKLHGDSVKDIAFAVDDATSSFEEVVRRGAHPVMEPTVYEQRERRIVKATVAACGDTVHSFIERHGGDGRFFPGCQTVKDFPQPAPMALTAIDHVAICVEQDTLKQWFAFYIDVFGFHHSHQEDIVTDNTAMNSGVVQNETGQVKFPIMEPAANKCRSQIEEYLAFHHGPGAQHIALLSNDIEQTVRALRGNGIAFLHTPDDYYDTLEERVGRIEEDVETLKQLNILVDRDRWGILKQVFTKPLHDRPTAFMEIIERKGARGFGGGNIKALFESIEREQARRGNLYEAQDR